MTVSHRRLVALLWRGESHQSPSDTRNYQRLCPISEALADAGVGVEHVLYSDAMHEAVMARLLRVDGVLVWVDPITGDEDRSVLDGVLRELSSSGVWVSTHPDVIEKMGTKEVLYRTKHLGWGMDTQLYASAAEFREQFPHGLGSGPRVLKPNRGNGGLGVWKVAVSGQPTNTASDPTTEDVVQIQHAAPRDDVTEDVSLGAFMTRWDGYFADGGKLIDQPFVSRLRDGMIRVYLVRDRVVGFALQHPDPAIHPDRVLGMPSAKTMSNEDDPAFRTLRAQLEQDWLPGLLTATAVSPDDLPLIWDADFLHGGTSGGYVLCEINVSSVLPFPPHAPSALARAVKSLLTITNW